jgi:hypothetical protein
MNERKIKTLCQKILAAKKPYVYSPSMTPLSLSLLIEPRHSSHQTASLSSHSRIDFPRQAHADKHQQGRADRSAATGTLLALLAFYLRRRGQHASIATMADAASSLPRPQSPNVSSKAVSAFSSSSSPPQPQGPGARSAKAAETVTNARKRRMSVFPTSSSSGVSPPQGLRPHGSKAGSKTLTKPHRRVESVHTGSSPSSLQIMEP